MKYAQPVQSHFKFIQHLSSTISTCPQIISHNCYLTYCSWLFKMPELSTISCPYLVSLCLFTVPHYVCSLYKVCYQSYHLFLLMQQVCFSWKIAAFPITVAELQFGQASELPLVSLPVMRGPLIGRLDARRRSRARRSRSRCLKFLFLLSLWSVVSLWWIVKCMGSPCGGRDGYVCLENCLCCGCCDIWWSAGEP